MFGSEYEEDYIMRQIKNIVKAVARVAFRADTTRELRLEQQADEYAARLTENAAAGHINEAENQLYADTENRDPAALAAGLRFYEYLNSLDDAFLKAHDFSREEVYEGLLHLVRAYELDGLAELFTEEEET